MPEEQVSETVDPKVDDKGKPIVVPDTPKEPELSPEDLAKKQLQDKINEALQPMKGNLDAAYAARDEALAKLAEITQKERDAEIQRLKDEGKHKEAYEKEMSVLKAEKEAIVKANIKLTRDVDLRAALSSTEFRSEKAAEMAFSDIRAELVQDEKGIWVHKSGVSIKDYTKTYLSNEDNSFLLKQKVSTGAGGTPTISSPVSGEKKSLFKMPIAEVLQMAAEGKLPGQQK